MVNTQIMLRRSGDVKDSDAVQVARRTGSPITRPPAARARRKAISVIAEPDVIDNILEHKAVAV